MRTIEIKQIGHRIKPLDLTESVIFTINMTEHLNGDTIKNHIFTVLDSDCEDVTANFGKSSSISEDICSIGIHAYAVGVYTIVLWITCNEHLPDNSTLRKFKIELILTIKLSG